MKKLTKEEAQAIPTRGRGWSTNFREALLAMQPGEHLLLHRSEWRWESKSAYAIPAEITRTSQGRIQFDCRTLQNGLGWLIKRVK
jgi:hypothetical protein